MVKIFLFLILLTSFIIGTILLKKSAQRPSSLPSTPSPSQQTTSDLGEGREENPAVNHQDLKAVNSDNRHPPPVDDDFTQSQIISIRKIATEDDPSQLATESSDEIQTPEAPQSDSPSQVQSKSQKKSLPKPAPTATLTPPAPPTD